MHEFNQLNIKESEKNFTGEKIKINKVLNKKIAVFDFRVKESKFEGNYTQIQVEVDTEKRVIFTKSIKLLDALEQAKKQNVLPFMTTIIEENEAFKFT